MAMANGEDDLREKNRGHKAKSERRYNAWNDRFGHEDSDMLMEKSSGWSARKESRGDYDDYGE